jgi:gluconate 5-dehydrogenase
VNDWLGLRDRTVLVAGAGGIGGVSALALAGLGARVLAVDVDQARLAQLADEVRAGGGHLEVIAADLSEPESCRSVVKEAAGRLGSIQVFLHAVGRNSRLPILDLDDATWSDLVNLNLSTAYWTGQAVGRQMCAAGYGRMVFVSSVSGLLAHAHHAPYAATKGGLNQLVRVMAREWAAQGVTVNAVAPGYIETDLTRDYLSQPSIREDLVSLVPAGRLGTATEVADAVTFLASDRAAFVNGHVLYVDGGRVLI